VIVNDDLDRATAELERIVPTELETEDA
jgi:hypothetical protein